MNPNLESQPTIGPRVIGWCCYCGNSDPCDPYVHLYDEDGTAHRLYCSDEAACIERAKARDQHMDERWAITPAGRELLQFIEQGEQLRIGAA
jgi:hypothetical protein